MVDARKLPARTKSKFHAIETAWPFVRTSSAYWYLKTRGDAPPGKRWTWVDAEQTRLDVERTHWEQCRAAGRWPSHHPFDKREWKRLTGKIPAAYRDQVEGRVAGVFGEILCADAFITGATIERARIASLLALGEWTRHVPAGIDPDWDDDEIRTVAEDRARADEACRPAAWWRKHLRSQSRKAHEMIGLALGVVRKREHGGRQEYVSPAIQRKRASQIDAQAEWMQAAKLRAGDIEISVADAWEHSPSNPAIRWGEIQARTTGFAELGAERGLWPVFVVVTCPSKMHAKSARWDGTSPKAAQKHLANCWTAVQQNRAWRRRQPLWMRTPEPHGDATPHWNLVVWWPADEIEPMYDGDGVPVRNAKGLHMQTAPALDALLRQYFLEPHDGDEPGANIHRVKVEPVAQAPADWAGGDPWDLVAVRSYISKYIRKTIAGGDDREPDSVARCDAWRSTWDVRAVAFGGQDTGSLTVWRQLRRLGQKVARTEADRRRDAGEDADMHDVLGDLDTVCDLIAAEAPTVEIADAAAAAVRGRWADFARVSGRIWPLKQTIERIDDSTGEVTETIKVVGVEQWSWEHYEDEDGKDRRRKVVIAAIECRERDWELIQPGQDEVRRRMEEYAAQRRKGCTAQAVAKVVLKEPREGAAAPPDTADAAEAVETERRRQDAEHRKLQDRIAAIEKDHDDRAAAKRRAWARDQVARRRMIRGDFGGLTRDEWTIGRTRFLATQRALHPAELAEAEAEAIAAAMEARRTDVWHRVR